MKTKWLVGMLILAVLISGCTQVPSAPQPTTTQPTPTKKIETTTPVPTPTTPPKTWHVPGDYHTIDAAIIAASPGDMIEVAPGSYPGFEVDKPLSIRGSDVNITIIEGEVDVMATGANIKGFTMGSMTIFGSGNEISDNTIIGYGLFSGYYSIYVSGLGKNKISNNTIKVPQSSDIDVIKIVSGSNEVSGNTIEASDTFHASVLSRLNYLMNSR